MPHAGSLEIRHLRFNVSLHKLYQCFADRDLLSALCFCDSPVHAPVLQPSKHLWMLPVLHQSLCDGGPFFRAPSGIYFWRLGLAVWRWACYVCHVSYLYPILCTAQYIRSSYGLHLAFPRRPYFYPIELCKKQGTTHPAHTNQCRPPTTTKPTKPTNLNTKNPLSP